MEWVVLLQLCLVAVAWGVTNPFLSRAGRNALSRGQQESEGARPGLCGRLRREVLALLGSWRFLVPYAVNQLGSALYLRALAQTKMSTVVVLCNGLTFVVTWLTSLRLGEAGCSRAQGLGIACTLLGLWLCVSA
jgi:hypothetical protein